MKRNSKTVKRIGAGFVTLFFFILASTSFAGMAVSPLQQWVEVQPGKEAFFSVTVTNTKRGPETQPCTVYVSVVDFTVSAEGSLSFGEEFRHERSAVDWIGFDAGEFVLEPGESKKIKAKISAPASADGDYWAAIMFRLGNPKGRENGIQVVLRTASGVFVRVARRNYIARANIINTDVSLPVPVSAETAAAELAWGQSSGDIEKEQAFEIIAELTNDGLIAFLAKGTAFLYTGNWHRAASIPLHTNRRRIFPGHSRYFTGVMSQPLPAGEYKLRVFFEPDAKYSRKITKDMEVSVSNESARLWAENFKGDDIQTLGFGQEELNLVLTPGRFTAAHLLVTNEGLNTVSISCHVEHNELPEGWVELKSDNFTLAGDSRRNLVCSVRIPHNAQQGEYNGIIHLEAERSGLTVEGSSNTEPYEIPIRITVK
jgi:hypothetical protein